MKKSKVLYAGFIVIVLIFVAPRVIKYFYLAKSEGTVVKINTGQFHSFSPSRSADFQYPTISFHTAQNKEILYSKDNEVLYSTLNISDKITVIYNPEKPDEAWLNLFGSFWFSLPDALLIVFFFILWIGVVNILFVKPRKKKTV